MIIFIHILYSAATNLLYVHTLRKRTDIYWKKKDLRKKVVTEISEILNQYHSKPMRGHSGINNTLVWWPIVIIVILAKNAS